MRITLHHYAGLDYTVQDLGCLVYFGTTQAFITPGGGAGAVHARGSTRATVHARIKAQIRALPQSIRDDFALLR